MGYALVLLLDPIWNTIFVNVNIETGPNYPLFSYFFNTSFQIQINKPFWHLTMIVIAKK